VALIEKKDAEGKLVNMVNLMDEVGEESDEKDKKVVLLEGKLKELNEESSELVNKMMSDKEQCEEPEKKSILVYCDDSTKEIFTKLKGTDENDWYVATDVSTTEDLLDKVRSKDYLRMVAKYNCVVIALGADEIASGVRSGYDVFENQDKIAKRLSEVAKTQVALCQPPPSRKRAGEFAILNSRIRGATDTDRIKYIITEKDFKLTLKSESVFEDSCILTDKGIKIYLSAIQNLVTVPGKNCTHDISSAEESDDSQGTEESDECNDDIDDIDETSPSVTIVVPSKLMGYIIGKGGRSINYIEANTNTKIKNISWKEQGKEVTGMLVRGNNDDITKAKDEINRAIKAGEKSLIETSKQLCKFYVEGTCTSGSYCRYKHDASINMDKKQKKTVSSASSDKTSAKKQKKKNASSASSKSKKLKVM
jgi:hypothetical protein